MLHQSNELNSLSQKLKQFNHQFFNEGESGFQIELNDNRKKLEELSNVDFYFKEGLLIIHNDKVGFVSYSASENDKPVFLPSLNDKKDIEFYQQYALLRDAYLRLTDSENTYNQKYAHHREVLNNAYNNLVSKYGILNSPANRQRILKDDAFGEIMLASLERKDGEQFIKADILTQSLITKQEVFHTDNVVEALPRSLNDTGKVDMQFIAAATGLEEANIIQSLGNHIYLNPANKNWETADQFLSGNVVSKLNTAKEKAEQNPADAQVQRSVEALEKVQPEKIPFELLDFNLGERWIPQDYYNRFASNLFELDTEVNYFTSLDTFKVTANGSNAKVSQEYAVTTKAGKQLTVTHSWNMRLKTLRHFLLMKLSRAIKQFGFRIMMRYNSRIKKLTAIRNGFVSWLKELPEEDKKNFEKLYNDTFNCYVLREYDGGHLNFPGLDKKNLGIEDLYSSQKNSAWRIIQNRGALIDHEVGLGKTLTMIVAAHEMKRLGIVHKPMILALKANVNQITETYRKAYPDAKIFAPGENDFTPAKRIRLFHEIKNNNWDCIILTHDQFGKIPQSPEIQREIFQTELDNVERDLHTLKDMGGEISKKMLKGLEIRKNNLDGKLKGVLNDIEQKKDAGINFKDLGVDHLFVDEAHKFKNLTFTHDMTVLQG